MWERKSKISIMSLIGPGTQVLGSLSFAGGLHVNGGVKGNVTGEERDPSTVLMLGESAIIEGEVRATRVILGGTVTGDVHGEYVELSERAKVIGNIYYQRLEMAIGAEVNGQLIHLEPKPT